MADLVIYVKAAVILLLVWRLLTIGIFGQIVSGVVAATLAFCLSRDNSLPKSVQDIAAPLDDLKRNKPLLFIVSVVLDILTTQYVPVPVVFKVVVGESGFAPIGTFLTQYLYDRPALTAIALLRAQLPFANLIPTATLGFLLDIGVIREEWVGGKNGPLKQI